MLAAAFPTTQTYTIHNDPPPAFMIDFEIQTAPGITAGPQSAIYIAVKSLARLNRGIATGQTLQQQRELLDDWKLFTTNWLKLQIVCGLDYMEDLNEPDEPLDQNDFAEILQPYLDEVEGKAARIAECFNRGEQLRATLTAVFEWMEQAAHAINEIMYPESDYLGQETILDRYKPFVTGDENTVIEGDWKNIIHNLAITLHGKEWTKYRKMDEQRAKQMQGYTKGA